MLRKALDLVAGTPLMLSSMLTRLRSTDRGIVDVHAAPGDVFLLEVFLQALDRSERLRP